MAEFLNRWMNEPLFVKIIIGVAGIIIILVLVNLLQRTLTKSIENPDLLYRARKIIVYLGYNSFVISCRGIQ